MGQEEQEAKSGRLVGQLFMQIHGFSVLFMKDSLQTLLALNISITTALFEDPASKSYTESSEIHLLIECEENLMPCSLSLDQAHVTRCGSTRHEIKGN